MANETNWSANADRKEHELATVKTVQAEIIPNTATDGSDQLPF